MKTLLFSLIFAMFSGLAFATPGNNGGGNGGCGVGQQTNGCGAAGGAGGQGGTGIGVGIAGAAAAAQANAAAAVVGSGNSANHNANVQGQSQSNRSNAAATGGSSSSGVNVEGSSTYIAAQERAPVATAYAAPLTASNGTCMGSSSAGAQGAAVGLSFGTTWTDSSCDIRYDAEALRAAGLPMAARARLCQKADIAKAMEAAGTPCPGAESKRANAILDGAPVAAGDAKYQDPIIRARLGLPPLK